MKFGEPSPDRTVTADGYMVGGGTLVPIGVKVAVKMCTLLSYL